MRFSAGDGLPQSGFWRGLARRARASRILALPPLYASPRDGQTLLIHRPTARMPGIITARSGTSYTVAEARFSPAGGTWAAVAGGRVVTAYEYNLATAIPVGTAVEVHYTRADDWRFERIKSGIVRPKAYTVHMDYLAYNFVYSSGPFNTVIYDGSGLHAKTGRVALPLYDNAGPIPNSAFVADLPPGYAVSSNLLDEPKFLRPGGFNTFFHGLYDFGVGRTVLDRYYERQDVNSVTYGVYDGVTDGSAIAYTYTQHFFSFGFDGGVFRLAHCFRNGRFNGFYTSYDGCGYVTYRTGVQVNDNPFTVNFGEPDSFKVFNLSGGVYTLSAPPSVAQDVYVAPPGYSAITRASNIPPDFGVKALWVTG